MIWCSCLVHNYLIQAWLRKCVNANKLSLVYLLQWNLYYISEPPIKRTRRPVRIYTVIRFHLKMQLFLYGQGFPPHVPNDNDHWNRKFSKMLFRVELFENTLLLCTCGRTRTELFENVDVTESIISTTSFPGSLFSASLGRWNRDPGCGWSRDHPESRW